MCAQKMTFPYLSHKIMVDATMGHETLSFMDESSRYNQIRMTLEDENKTTFQALKDIVIK